jgi:hypothetical protein
LLPRMVLQLRRSSPLRNPNSAQRNALRTPNHTLEKVHQDWRHF